MGAIKSNNFTTEEKTLYLFHRALAHPVRIRMLNKLKERSYRNVDFSFELNLSTSTVKDHIDKLKDSDLVQIEYFVHHYSISLDLEKLAQLKNLEN